MLGLIVGVSVALVPKEILFRVLATILALLLEFLVGHLIFLTLLHQHLLILFKRIVLRLLDLYLPLNCDEGHLLVNLWVQTYDNVLENLLGHENKVRLNGSEHAASSLPLEDDVKVTEITSLNHVLEGDSLLL